MVVSKLLEFENILNSIFYLFFSHNKQHKATVDC